MNTSHTLLKSAASLDDVKLNPIIVNYFEGATLDEAHEEVLKTFSHLSREKGVTRAFLARRIDKSPEQITRWLSAPGNWTLQTLAQLALAMGYRVRIYLERLAPAQEVKGESRGAAPTKSPANGAKVAYAETYK